MFGNKNVPQYPWNEPEGEAEWEYYVVAGLGGGNFTTMINQLARRGWEMFGGCMAGTAHYAYMRRPASRRPAGQASL